VTARQWFRLQRIHLEAWVASVRLWWRRWRERRRLPQAAAVAYGKLYPDAPLPRGLSRAAMRKIVRRRRHALMRTRRAGFTVYVSRGEAMRATLKRLRGRI
jgi:hypothetical protein